MFGVDLGTVGVALLMVFVGVVGLLCIYPNYLRQNGIIEGAEPEVRPGVAQMRIEASIINFLADQARTADEIMDAVKRYRPEDVWATLLSMHKKNRLQEEKDPKLGYVYRVV